MLGIAQKTNLIAERTAQTNPGRKEQVMADEKEELESKNDEGAEGEGEQQESKQEGKQPAEGEGKDGGEIKDKHGQPGINKERHEKEMAEKDAKIAELEAKIAEAAKTEEGRKKLQEEIEKLKADQADERVKHKLEMAGCRFDYQSECHCSKTVRAKSPLHRRRTFWLIS